MNRAYLVRQADYDVAALESAVDRIFSAFGFYEKLRETRQVVVKPNLVMKSAPEEAIITHPNLVAAVALCLIVLAFDLISDGLRAALDPRAER